MTDVKQDITSTAIPAVAIDFESTCSTIDAQATELGLCPVIFSASGILNPRMDAVAIRCKPDRDITFGAMAITGICAEDVEHEPHYTDIAEQFLPKGAAYIIGHNIDFDIQVAKNADIDVGEYKAICTLAIARNLYPDAQHSLTALLYMLDYDYARQHAQHAHSAAHDVRFCIRLLRIFCRQAGITDMQTLYELSEESRIPKVLPMGKHKGRLIADMTKDPKDREYLDWVIKNVSDPYLVKACQVALNERKKDKS